jgi:hypothetical protein
MGIYPAGTSGRLDVANVAVAALVAEMLAPARVTLPRLVTVEPSVTVVLPIVELEFWRPELGMVRLAVTGLVLLAYMYPVKVVTVRVVTVDVSPPSTLCQTDPLNTAQSPTPHSVVPSRLVLPATDTT